MRFIFFLLYSVFLFSNELKHTVYFETNKSDVSLIERNRLISFVEELNYEDLVSVKISGFCDDIGSDSYNLDLSLNRANNIKRSLISNSISSEKIISVNGKGEIFLEKYSSKNPDVIRALNRRVEIIFITKNKKEETFKIEKGSSLVLENILFLTGYSYLMPSSKKKLDIIYNNIKKDSFSFIIRGHVCCTSGQKDAIDRATKKRNLSVVRAKFIYNYFLKKGISKSRMSYEGVGNKFPLGGKPEKDRRVEILITSDF